MAAWSDAKSQLATLLATVAITSPIAQTIKRVYSDPPGSVQDWPCFIIYPPSVEALERAISLRITRYRVRLRLLVSDQDLDQAAAFVDNYREATLDMFDSNVTLNGGCTEIDGPTTTEAVGFTYGSRNFVGMDFLLGVEIKEAVEFAA